MQAKSYGRITGLAVLLALTLAGCGGGGTAGDSPGTMPPVAAGVDTAAPSTDTASAAPGSTQPAEIYYDLTIFEWYRQGEPLVVDGRAYEPIGHPESIRGGALERVGVYGGVAYYVPRGYSPHQGVLVPVFEGYWQPFLPVPPDAFPAE
jgi:hypothetical protein